MLVILRLLEIMHLLTFLLFRGQNMKVRLDTQADGFIYAWGTDYTSDNVVDIDENELKRLSQVLLN
ncbi:MAG: hypothetical protein ACFWT8_06870 [Lacticaseibacillus casei]